MTPQHRAAKSPRRNRGWLGVAATAALVATSLGGAAFAATNEQQADSLPLGSETHLSEENEDFTTEAPEEGIEGTVGSTAPDPVEGEEGDSEEAGEGTTEENGVPMSEEPDNAAAADDPDTRASDATNDPEQGFFAGPYRSMRINRAAGKPVIPVFEEDFQNTSGIQTLVGGVGGTRYTGVTGMQYSAWEYWGFPNRCNGIILSQDSVSNPLNNTSPGSCNNDVNGFWRLREQARLLGLLSGHSPNYALTELSSGWANNNDAAAVRDGVIGVSENPKPVPDPLQSTVDADGLVQFEMGSPVALPKDSPELQLTDGSEGWQDLRFLAAQMNVAVVACPKSDQEFGGNYVSPLFNFKLVDASGNSYPLFDPNAGDYLNPCANSSGLTATKIKSTSTAEPDMAALYGTLFTKSSVPWFDPGDGAPAVRVVLVNHQKQSLGNDSSVDEIKITDVTPYLDVQFAQPRVKYGDWTAMTITVNSREDLSEKAGWGFTNTLPAGLVTDTGATSVSVASGTLSQGQASLAYDYQVTAPVPADRCPADTTFTNGLANFGGATNADDARKYVDFDYGDEVTFYGTGQISWTKTDSVTGDPVLDAVFTLTGPDGAIAVPSPDANGTYTVTDLEYGDYTITETASPEGYEEPTWSQTVTIGAGDESSCVKSFEVTNDPMPRLTLVKAVDNPEGATNSAGYLEATDWTLSAERTDDAGLEGPSGTTGLVTSGSYSLGESSDAAAAASYDLTSLVCENSGSGEFVAPSFEESDGVITPVDVTLAPGNDVTCTFTNTPKPGSVTWTKVDRDTNELLANSEWLLTGPGLPGGGLQITDCVADQASDCAGPDVDPKAGVFKVDGLAWGEYRLKEIKAPAGYELDGTVHTFSITYGRLSFEFEDPFENTQMDVPTLPNTGGRSAVVFTILGLVIAGGGGAAAVYVNKRRNA